MSSFDESALNILYIQGTRVDGTEAIKLDRTNPPLLEQSLWSALGQGSVLG